MQLYRPMLKQALSITWRYKYLWFFGLFAAIMGNGGAFNLGINNLNKVESGAVWLTNFKSSIQNLRFNFFGFNLADVWQTVDIWGIILVLIIILLSVFLIWLSISCQGALVYGAKEALGSRGELFSESIKKGSSKFWPVLLLNIILNLIILVVLFLINLPFMILFLSSGNTVVWQTILLILSFIVLVPFAIVLSLIVRYAVIYVVNQDKHIGEAIQEAWKLFVKNWIVSLEMGVLLFLLNILTGLLLIVLMVFVALPFVMLAMIAAQFSASGFLWLIFVLGILTFVVLMFLYAAAWNTFVMVVWVNLFERLNTSVVYSKILRLGVWLTGGKKEEESNQ